MIALMSTLYSYRFVIFYHYLDNMMSVKMPISFRGLHFKVVDFIGHVSFFAIAKTKLTLLALLYCREVVKDSNRKLVKGLTTHIIYSTIAIA